jgi:serine/threonine protein kinase
MINQKYTIKMQLGKGGFSEVFLVTDQTGANYAVKLIKKELLAPKTSFRSYSEKVAFSEELDQKKKLYLNQMEKETL